MTYVVWAKSSSPRDTLVGYATGDPEDIMAYFNNRAEYGLYLQEMKVVDVMPGYAEKYNRITKEVAALRAAADALEKEL